MGRYLKVSNSITRPNNATQYGDTDLVAQSETAGSCTPFKFKIGTGGFSIKRMTLSKSDSDVTAAEFTLHFYDTDTAPITSAGDNAAWTKVASAIDGYMGEVDVVAMTAGSDDDSVQTYPGDTGYAVEFHGYSANGTIYAWVVNDSTYTPLANEVFTLELIVESHR